MNFKAPVLLTAISTLFLLSCSKNLKPPEFRNIGNVRVNKVNTKETLVFLDVRYFNPNKSKLKLKWAEGDAWLEDIPIGHFKVDTSISIPANADFYLPVRMQVSMDELLKKSFVLLTQPEVTIKVEGTARVGKSGFFIKYPIHYEGKQKVADILDEIRKKPVTETGK